jgi:PAS domain S-box-containing protein
MHLLSQQVSDALNTRRPAIAAQMVARELARQPELEQRHGDAGRERCLEDAGYHLAYLAQAIAADSVALFGDYVGWAKVMLAKRGIPALDLGGLLEVMKETLQQELPPEFSRLAGHFLDHGLQRLPQLSDDVPCFIAGDTPLAPLARAYLQALLRGERQIASQLILDAARQGTAVRDLYLQVFQRTQYEIGRLWQVNQISVAQEHYCTAATQLIMSQLHPYIFGGEKTRGTLVATCVSGELHEIGVRMVSDFFEMDGWHTYYLGANTPVSAVVQTLVDRQAAALAISATITYHVRGVESLIAAVRRTPDCGGVKILVGGYPFKIDPGLWKLIGADGSAPDAEAAIRLANRLTNQVPRRMNHDSANPEISPPAAAREPAPTGRVPIRLDDHLYEELSRINNELANHQRELARTNAEMAATQKKLAISEQRFRNLSACLPIGIFELDAAGRCIYTNSHWQTISGLTAEESLGDGWQRALDPRDAPAFLEERTQARQTGREFSREVRFVNTRGDERWAQVRSRAIPAGDGQAASRVSTVEDITERKRAEELQKKMALELQHAQKLEAIGTLAAGIAHEINTPAQYIEHNLRFLQENFPRVGQLLDFYQGLSRDAQADGGARELLFKAGGEDVWSAQRSLVEEIPEAINDALEGIGRVITIVRAMKDFAHPGVGSTESPVEINLNRAIESTIIVARNEWRYVADVVTEFDPKLPSVPVQPGAFNQVVLNVLVNAAQAIEEAIKKDGREKGTITISTHQDGEWVEVRVRDTGPGIPENIRHRIFEPFFTTKPIGQGTGQGLAISRSVIVEKHKGEFSFDTELGKGTCFKIRLPVQPSRSVGDFTPAPPENPDPK